MYLPSENEIYSVSELNRTVKRLLESNFQLIYIEGEISNLSRPTSGHFYFTLKDDAAQVRCAMFKLQNQKLPFQLENGMHILAHARVSLYEGRGDYQLIIEHLEDKGEGVLRRRFELLKNKLAEEGLFDLSHKKSLPKFPRQIGVITSPTGAAIRDVLAVLKRRFSSIPVILYPTQVQGQSAAMQIAEAISLANRHDNCDVLLLCRGGGSLEDLFAFNEECVARAIFQSKIPTVSGIGHEVDFTIADFVVDQRAPTPSAAAELISPDRQDYIHLLIQFSNRLAHIITTDLRQRKIAMDYFQKQFSQPSQLIQQHLQTIDIILQSITRGIIQKIAQQRSLLELTALKLQTRNPAQQLQENQLKLTNFLQLLSYAMSKKIADLKHQLAVTSRALNTISPLNTLERGYSIATKEGQVVEDVGLLNIGDKIKVQLKTGHLSAVIEDIYR